MRIASIVQRAVAIYVVLNAQVAFAQTYVTQPLVTPTGYLGCLAYGIADNGITVGTCFPADGLFRAVIWRDGVAEVPPLPSGYNRAEGIAVNAGGTIIGACYEGRVATIGCVWENGAVRLLPSPAGMSAFPLDINDLGYVSGWVANPGSLPQAAIWSPSGVLTLLPVGADASRAEAMNDSGAVAVNKYGADVSAAATAAIWTSSGVTELPVPAGHTLIQVLDINNHGDVVGATHDNLLRTRAVLWRNGIPEVLTLPNGALSSQAHGINDSTQISGNADHRPALWRGSAGQTLSELGGAAYRISNAGVVAGTAGGVAVLFAPQTPSQEAEILAENIQTLITDGSVDSRDGSALQTHISAAVARIAADNHTAASNVLSAFKNKVSALLQSGRLSEADAMNLTAAADALITRL